MTEDAYERSRLLAAPYLRRRGMRRGVYDGGNNRRFCLFISAGDGTEWRHEFDTKTERDNYTLRLLSESQ